MPAYIKSALVITAAGTAFSGYLSGIKFFNETCAFNEPCPYFLGLPACYFGLVMYVIMLGATAAAAAKRFDPMKAARVNLWVSAAGIVFAGRYVVQEAALWLKGIETSYSLGLPTCAWGLIFYVIVFILSLLVIRDEGRAKTRVPSAAGDAASGGPVAPPNA